MTKPIRFQYKSFRIGLKPFTESDIESSNYRSWFHDPDVTKFNSHGVFPCTDADVDSFINSMNDKTKIVFAIYALGAPEDFVEDKMVANGKNICFHIGNISLQNINLINRSAELAIIIGETDYHRKGIGEEAVNMVLYHAIYRMGLHRVWGGTAATNIGMQRIFEKTGFKKEGVMRDGMWLNGGFVDTYSYAVLKKDLENA